ncbi:MAG: PmoA family protein [Verrucomicrobiae bacterium]|nr:PmoA family protein [Verrucomicrobiae bacterium]
MDTRPSPTRPQKPSPGINHPIGPRRFFLTVITLSLSVATSIFSPRFTQAAEVRITKLEDKLRIELGGNLFCEYVYSATNSRPYIYPILGPGGLPMTRNWPMREVEGEERDHPHHRSFWWAHGDINGVDFWSESARSGKTLHDTFLAIEPGNQIGTVRSRNRLIKADGTLVGLTEQTMRFWGDDNARWIDFEITVRASNGELVFGDTKEGTMAVRLAETMRLKPNKAGLGAGHIINSEGIRDNQAWGKRARWVDYHGPVQNQLVGLAIFDHPNNPRHPTWWHVRDYGLFAANPFGIHDFERKPAQTGNLVVPSGESITFKYRFYLHRGADKTAAVAEKYNEYVREIQSGR